MSKTEEQGSDGDTTVENGHLDDVADGCGCVEIWENLSDRRQQTD